MSDDSKFIRVRGARENNLKSINVDIPRNRISVITGLSGSGKSSLAFDTVYAEGQRRYVEGLSAYARNFLDQLKKPEIDSISGLSPSIAIDQRTISTNPRSTVGTTTELYDFLRLLYARIGTPVCPTHKVKLTNQTPQQIIDEVLSLPQGNKIHILSPVVRNRKGEFLADFQKWLRMGYVRARIDGKYSELESQKKLAKTKVHNIELLIDRLIIKENISPRLTDSINAALSLSHGFVIVEVLTQKKERLFSLDLVCPQCGISFPEMDPKLFSFNNPRGSCPDCNGLGYLINGEDDYVNGFTSEEVENEQKVTCPTCNGARLNQEALSVTIADKSIAEVSNLSIKELTTFISELELSKKETIIAKKSLENIQRRLTLLQWLGVDYLSLDRTTKTLSGGEAQRIRLAGQLSSSMVGVLYVLDEPSIGLHPKDHDKLIQSLKELRDRGNTVLVVEHDEMTMRNADLLFDLGPRAGKLGGEVVSKGRPEEVENDSNSITGGYLSGRLSAIKQHQREKAKEQITIKGARGHNLKNIDVSFPLENLIGVTGVSGSGKSTLVIDTLFKYLSHKIYQSVAPYEPFESLSGIEHIDSVAQISQKPIGRTPRSNPATYVGLFSPIRSLFSQLPESRIRGYKPGRFSFNVKGGRCEACQGDGLIKIEMHFLPDVFVRCDVCQGRRYNRETLAVKLKGKSIADVLEMSVAEALEFFDSFPQIKRKLDTLNRVGLDYITLGQSSTTLSGGEAQRIKLAKELSKKGSGRTLYILDEPTTGLHFADVSKLIELLHELVDKGNTVIVIEHNLDVIKSCDHVIDLGPGGGVDGGHIIDAATPETLAKNDNSFTGQFLKSH
jgi:excinuclease ABC subunit A